jgi:hypothetical protein
MLFRDVLLSIKLSTRFFCSITIGVPLPVSAKKTNKKRPVSFETLGGSRFSSKQVSQNNHQKKTKNKAWGFGNPGGAGAPSPRVSKNNHQKSEHRPAI